jgi:hypothetical protein
MNLSAQSHCRIVRRKRSRMQVLDDVRDAARAIPHPTLHRAILGRS